MDDADNARVAGEHIFTRIILGELMVAWCMGEEDPVAETLRRRKALLDSADNILDPMPANELFKHRYLHEMETFWETVLREVRARVQRGQP